MTKKMIQTALLLLATLAIAHARDHITAAAHLQSLLSDCAFEIVIPSRDGSGLIDFIVCVKDDSAVCTTRRVEPCNTMTMSSCEGFQSTADEELFLQLFPAAYAQVCKESDGELCLSTNIAYTTCAAEAQDGDQRICLPLSNGEVECAYIPEEQIVQLQTTYNNRENWIANIAEFVKS